MSSTNCRGYVLYTEIVGMSHKRMSWVCPINGRYWVCHIKGGRGYVLYNLSCVVLIKGGRGYGVYKDVVGMSYTNRRGYVL